MDALPGPSTASGVPNFVIRKFRVPVFLLPIYQAAGIQYGVRWEVLAAINEIETDYGRNLNVSSAGALGWMQFIPSSWRMYGVDANKDGKKDPYNPVDAIFAAARYLKAAGYEKDVRRSIFAYNHADWYVDSVMLRAKLISGVPADLVGSLTGLTEGRFPVAARARYADDLQEKEAAKRVKRGQNAANVVESDDDRDDIEIFAKQGAPVVATNDGEIKKIGVSKKLGRYVTLQDVYGNRYTYSGLGSTAKYYPVPKEDAGDPKLSARAVKANGDDARTPSPTASASAGRQPTKADKERPKAKLRLKANKASAADDVEPRPPRPSVPIKERLFAHPDMPLSRENGGLDQLLDAKGSKGFETYANYFSRPFGANAKDVRLRRLKVGSRVIGGTILGRIGAQRRGQGLAPDLRHPPRRQGRAARSTPSRSWTAGSCWRPPRSTAPRAATPSTATTSNSLSIGQVLLLPKPLLEKRVLSDNRIEIYDGGQDDIKTGQIDRRVLATLAYLAESGPQAHGHLAEGQPRLLHRLRQRLPALLGQRGRHRQDQRHPHPGPPGGGRDHRADRAPASCACRAPWRPTRSSACSSWAARRWPWATTPTTSTWASGRCSATTRSSGARPWPCSSRASGPTCSSSCARSTTRSCPRSPRSTRCRPSRRPTPIAASSAAAPFGFVQLEFGYLLGPGRRPLPGAPRRAPRSSSACWRCARSARPSAACCAGAAAREVEQAERRAGAHLPRHGHPPRAVRGRRPRPQAWLTGLRGVRGRARGRDRRRAGGAQPRPARPPDGPRRRRARAT